MDNNHADSQESLPTPDLVRSASGSSPSRKSTQSLASLNRQILNLALPALGSLVAEPLLLLADTAMVGHLGTAQLAGLSVASAILTLLIGLCIFLAYTTTSVTARHLGAGNQAMAIKSGLQGMWLASLLGIILGVLLALFAPVLTYLAGGSGSAAHYSIIYLRASAPGLVGMLIVLAATGTLRGLLDTRTPFVVAFTGALVNIPLNALLIYGFQWGVAGSGIGTALSQTLMALTLVAVVVRGARRSGVSLGPSWRGIGQSGMAGVPLVVRTATLQISILATVAVVGHMGQVELAGHQVIKTTWALAANVLDALAIAAQALVGHSLGQANQVKTRQVLQRCLWWGAGAGVLVGVLIAVASPLWPGIFSADLQVHQVTLVGLLVAALMQPLAGLVFMYDGVLIGAGDGRYLAVAGIFTLLAYLPTLWVLDYLELSGAGGLAWVWFGYSVVFFGARYVTLALRARSDVWMKIGEDGVAGQ